MTLASVRTLAASVITGAARVVIGLLWFGEGLTKLRANFGGADILLVADSAQGNSRVPEFYQAFTESGLRGASDLFGFVIPLLETGLGIALILGILTLPAAIVSTLTLMMYWLADQLTWQYPIMVALGLVVTIWPIAASRISVSSLLIWLRGRSRPNSMLNKQELRRWL